MSPTLDHGQRKLCAVPGAADKYGTKVKWLKSGRVRPVMKTEVGEELAGGVLVVVIERNGDMRL
jgi:hypothetical protein